MLNVSCSFLDRRYLQQNDIFDVEPGTLANLLRLERLYIYARLMPHSGCDLN